MPLLLRRCSAQKSSLRLPEALHSKASGAFDPIRGGRLPPRAPPPQLKRIHLIRGFLTSCSRAALSRGGAALIFLKNSPEKFDGMGNLRYTVSDCIPKEKG